MFGDFLNLDNLGSFLLEAGKRIIPALICITFHELAHGFTAYRLGDRTAKDMGRLTLNPIKHIDIFGLIMMMIFRFGWAKPVPVNMNNFKKPKLYMAITAFAGPLSNLILSVVVLFLYGLVFEALGGFPTQGVGLLAHELFQTTAYINIALAFFNLLPIPPLDGSKMLFSLLPEEAYYKLMRYERYGMIALVVFLNTPVFRDTFGKLTQTTFEFLFTVVVEASYSMVH